MKELTLTHIGRIIGEQIWVGDKFWTIREVTTSMHGNHYAIFFRNTPNALMLRREIAQIQYGEPHVVLYGMPANGTKLFTSVITLKEMGDMVTFLDALSDRLNDYSDKWNGR
jgi:hypothetical protein